MAFKYRPDIEGLRAIAVLAVILYHANIYFGSEHLFKGGFFGVDVFFVISGFLITGLIIAELEQNGHFLLLNFYERRVRRIFPLLFFVILSSIPFALKYLLPSQLIDFSKSLIASLSFGSNFYWHYAFQEHNAESSIFRPFVHTWSLSLEEQFYLCFPFVIIMIHRRKPVHRLLALSLIILSGLLLAQWITLHDASLSFHMLSGRFWELATGAILAFTSQEKPYFKTFFSRWLPACGLFLILYSIMFIPFSFGTHPGYITLIPVLGTALVIQFYCHYNPTTQLLSHKLATGIGLISYSLYLWHYPIFAFGYIRNPHPNLYHKAIWILLTFALSILSYFWIERPFRSRSTISRKTVFLFTVTAMAGISIFSIYTIQHNG